MRVDTSRVPLNVSMYECKCVCMYVFVCGQEMRIYIYIYCMYVLCTYVCTVCMRGPGIIAYVCMCVSIICVCMHVMYACAARECVCMYACMYLCMYLSDEN
jgi:hypothetical protein